MGVYIKNMAIPKSGYVDVRIFHDGRAMTQTGEHPFYREMDVLEIQPHDRLIDADALKKEYPIPNDWTSIAQTLYHITGIWAEIDNAPTVIPAEEGET